MPSLISLSKWFLRERLTASSLAVLGSSLGAGFYVLLGDYLVRRYDLQGSLLVLAALHLNCLVGSLLLCEENVPYSLLEYNRNHQRSADLAAAPAGVRTREPFKAKTASLTFLVTENEVDDTANNTRPQATQVPEVTETTKLVEPAMGAESSQQTPVQPQPRPPPRPLQNQHMREYQNRRANNQKRKSALRRNLLLASAAADSGADNQSAISSSTTSYNNYTLKQYWRKFVQTRQSSNNAKKNLFHLIAEEKKKTKSQSKTSLEDGFVITTSNNLLAPNDDENVIIFNRKTALLDAIRTANNNDLSGGKTPATPSNLVSRFKVRIANSIRNIAASMHSSSVRLGQNNDDSEQDAPIKFSDNANLNNNNNSKLPARVLVSNEVEADKASQESAKPETPQLEFLSIFDGPITVTSRRSASRV